MIRQFVMEHILFLVFGSITFGIWAFWSIHALLKQEELGIKLNVPMAMLAGLKMLFSTHTMRAISTALSIMVIVGGLLFSFITMFFPDSRR